MTRVQVGRVLGSERSWSGGLKPECRSNGWNGMEWMEWDGMRESVLQSPLMFIVPLGRWVLFMSPF